MLPLVPMPHRFCLRAALPLFVLLFFISCATSPVLRSLKDVRDAYRPGDWAYIESLMDASTQPNRDVQAASLDRLWRYYENLAKTDASTWPLTPAQESLVTETQSKVRRARLLELKTKGLEIKKEEVRRHFERVFALSTDFNVRNLCLLARSRCGDEGATVFITRAVSDADGACAEWALKLLRPLLKGTNSATTLPASSVLGLEATLDIFAKSEGSLFLTALGNLLIYPPRAEITQALTRYRDLCSDPDRRALVEQALSNRKRARK